MASHLRRNSSVSTILFPNVSALVSRDGRFLFRVTLVELTGMATTKAELRQKHRRARDNLAVLERATLSTQLCGGLQRWLATQPAGTIFAYFPFGSEPDIAPLLPRHDARLALPIIGPAPRAMTFHLWQPGQPTQVNRFGIQEPLLSAPMVAPEHSSIVLVPALAIDRNGHRLGYGGGYYDTYLQGYPEAQRVGVVFEASFGSDVCAAPHDLAVGWVATENGVRRVTR